MKKLLTLAAAAAVLTLPLAAQAGWEYCIPASAFQVGGTFGSATRSLGASNRPYISFASGADSTASAEFRVPAFLSSITLTAKAYGRINSTTTGNAICMLGGASVSVAGDTDSLWENNVGTGNSSSVQTLAPLGTANAIITNGTAISFTPYNQGTAANCASVAACSTGPARLFVQRFTDASNPGSCPNDDSAAFELESLCLFGSF